MSHGQSFLLLLFCFYFLECFALVAPGSRVFVRGFGKRFRTRSCLLDLGGIRRQVYFLYFLPWPGRAHIFPGPGESSRPLSATPPNYARHLRFLNAAADGLATQGLLLWLVFFVVLPATYWFDPFDVRVLLFAGLGYVLLFWQTVRFFALHRRFHPDRGEERLKHALTMVFLPWHGMKAADYLALRPGLRLQPIHLEALLLAPSRFRRRAQLAWRRARHLPGASGEDRQALEGFLRWAGLGSEQLDAPPPGLRPGERFCPVCHTPYVSGARNCPDCGGIPLQVPAQAGTAESPGDGNREGHPAPDRES